MTDPTPRDHDHADDRPREGLQGLVDRFRHSISHDHDAPRSAGALIDTGEAGIRATKVSLLGLGFEGMSALMGILALAAGVLILVGR